MFRIICQDQLQHRIHANRTFECFVRLLKHVAWVSVHCRLLFACLSGLVCLCAIISHHCSVQMELWAATPLLKTDSRGPREILFGPVPMQSDVIRIHTPRHTKKMCPHEAPWDIYSCRHSLWVFGISCVCVCMNMCSQIIIHQWYFSFLLCACLIIK